MLMLMLMLIFIEELFTFHFWKDFYYWVGAK